MFVVNLMVFTKSGDSDDSDDSVDFVESGDPG